MKNIKTFLFVFLGIFTQALFAVLVVSVLHTCTVKKKTQAPESIPEIFPDITETTAIVELDMKDLEAEVEKEILDLKKSK